MTFKKINVFLLLANGQFNGNCVDTQTRDNSEITSTNKNAKLVR